MGQKIILKYFALSIAVLKKGYTFTTSNKPQGITHKLKVKIMKIAKNIAYKINPEFEESDATYFLAETAKDGAYFHKINENGKEVTNRAWFNATEIEDGVLVEISAMQVANAAFIPNPADTRYMNDNGDISHPEIPSRQQ